MPLCIPKKYIATIVKDDFHANEFDEEVNDLVDEGYNLTKHEHYFINDGEKYKIILYAELEKFRLKWRINAVVVVKIRKICAFTLNR